MEAEFLEKIQKRVIDLLKTLSDDLQIAAKDQCSEVARLVGCWILAKHPEYKVQIYKGELSDGLAHDILIVDNSEKLFLLDPTIWQIFPESDSVLIGSVGELLDAIDLLQKKYGGAWKVSETMDNCSETYRQELLTIIRSNR